MCGIVGVLLYESDMDREDRLRAIDLLFSNTMLLTEERGKDATGIFQVHEDGDWQLLKKGQKVSEFLFLDEDKKDPFIYRDLVSSWYGHPKELKTVVGHCRARTVGTEYNNANNHPFAIDLEGNHAILGVHNGTLKNHERIFDLLKTDLKRQGNVDSEAIFHMLYQQTEAGTLPITGEMIKWMAERLDGSYAVITTNTRMPNIVATFRDQRPMEYFLISPLNVVVIASESKFVKSALSNYEISRAAFGPGLPKLKFTDRTLAERDYRIFDLSLPFPTKLDFNCVDDISTKGDAGGLIVISDWKPTYSSGGSSSTFYSDKGAQTGVYSGTQSQSAAASTGTTTSAEKKEENKSGEATTEIMASVVDKPEQQAEYDKALSKARALGLCTRFDIESDLKRAFGREGSKVDTANMAQELGFCVGYAAGLIDTETERIRAREQVSALNGRLEQTMEKKQRASSTIWELRAIIQAMLALQGSGRAISARNIEVVLSRFPGTDDKRRKELISMFKTLLHTNDTQNNLEAIREMIKNISSSASTN